MERNHSRGAVAAQAYAKQSGGWRSCVSQCAKPGLRRWLPRNASQHHAGKGKVWMVEYIKELTFNPQIGVLGQISDCTMARARDTPPAIEYRQIRAGR